MSRPGPASGRGEVQEPQRRGLILQLYMDFLKETSNSKSTLKRQELTATVQNYLNLVGTHSKFITDDFLDIFTSCIESYGPLMIISELEAVIAAFAHLEEFFIRLINEPWRTEFRTVKLYNSAFITSILPSIKEASMIFTNLGFQMLSSHSLSLPPSAEVDLVAASAVACDLLIAVCECYIIKQVFLTLASVGHTPCPITIHEIWQERKKTICSPETCAVLLAKRLDNVISSKLVLNSSHDVVNGPIPQLKGSIVKSPSLVNSSTLRSIAEKRNVGSGCSTHTINGFITHGSATNGSTGPIVSLNGSSASLASKPPFDEITPRNHNSIDEGRPANRACVEGTPAKRPFEQDSLSDLAPPLKRAPCEEKADNPIKSKADCTFRGFINFIKKFF